MDDLSFSYLFLRFRWFFTATAIAKTIKMIRITPDNFNQAAYLINAIFKLILNQVFSNHPNA
ncbi:hypothetical protein IWT30_00479 [Secundilactobacillus mixtipabuli]|uniref:Uncharacterized protein n=1 Tax=Secundilactobacillus mixtipabuli TaxID=1435342 RepID=A0A1Z5I9X5_9LACO|nr:hypothetical protein IWT30_00479 [Secundilactobacillus mixtipabuli]